MSRTGARIRVVVRRVEPIIGRRVARRQTTTGGQLLLLCSLDETEEAGCEGGWERGKGIKG